MSFVDEHRDQYGVEPICRDLPIAPSTFYEHQARRRDPDLRSDREKRDEERKPEILRMWLENRCVYGAHKIWQQSRREGCTIGQVPDERYGNVNSYPIWILDRLFANRLYLDS